jgi:uncharacterized protein YfaS (alpha-2-macroglobulin family)
MTPSASDTASTMPEGAMPPIGSAVAAGPGNGDGRLTDGGGPLVTGRIHQPDGSPVGGAAVRLIDTSGRPAGRASAGPDGSFQIAAPGAGLYTLVAMAAAHQPQASMLRVGNAADGPVYHDVMLTGTSRLTGTVRAAGTGAPVARATLTLTGPGGEVLAARTTDATGQFLFTDLVAGDYNLAVSAPAREPTALHVTVAGSGETLQDVELAGQSRLAGTVRTAEGRPVPEAQVALLNPDGTVATATSTGKDGSYCFDDLPPGEYTVVASGYPPVAQPVRIAPGERHTHDPLLGHPQER